MGNFGLFYWGFLPSGELPWNPVDNNWFHRGNNYKSIDSCAITPAHNMIITGDRLAITINANNRDNCFRYLILLVDISTRSTGRHINWTNKCNGIQWIWIWKGFRIVFALSWSRQVFDGMKRYHKAVQAPGQCFNF